MTKEYTIKDVAQQAGVSISTVSRVLNKNVPVSPKLKEKVLNAVEAMNYNPNAMARGLINKKSQTIAVIIPDLSNPFFSETIRGIDDVLSSKGFSIMLYNTYYNKEKEKRYLNEIIERRIDGLIIISSYIENQHLIDRIKDKINVVSVQSTLEGVDSINVTDEDSAYNAVEYLINNGHRKIAFMGWEYEVEALAGRLKGYKKALKKNKIPFQEKYHVKSGITREEACIAALNLMDLKDPPTAILAINDNTALGIMAALKKKNIKIPDDVSIIGYDNIPFSELVSPTLTTIAQPIYLMGQEAGELVLNNIEKDKIGIGKKILLPTKLIERETVKKIN